MGQCVVIQMHLKLPAFRGGFIGRASPKRFRLVTTMTSARSCTIYRFRCKEITGKKEGTKGILCKISTNEKTHILGTFGTFNL